MPNTARLASYFQALVEGTRQDFRDQCESVLFKTSEVVDGASAVAHCLDSPSYVTAGAKLLSVRNATVEKFSVDLNGSVNGYTLNASLYLLSQGGVYGQSFIANDRTIASSAPMLQLAQTWNNGAVTFKALTIDITDTASASGSLLMDLMVASSSMFSVTKAAYVILGGNGCGLSLGAGGNWFYGAGVNLYSGASFSIGNGFPGTGGAAMTRPDTDTMALLTGGTERVRITSSGNVGIGTTSPSAKLHVNGGRTILLSGDYLQLGILSANSTYYSWLGVDNSGTFGIYDSGGTQTFFLTQGGNPTFQANALVANFIAPSANVFMRLADSATSGTRKEFTTLVDMTASAVTMTAVQQGVGYMPIYFEGSKICLNAGTGGNVGIGTTSPTAGYAMTVVQPDNGDYGGIHLLANNLSQSVSIGWHRLYATYTYQFIAPGFEFHANAGAALVLSTIGDATLTPAWTAGTTTFTGFKVNVTDTASAAGSLLMDLQVASTSMFSVQKNGYVAAKFLTVYGGSTQGVSISYYQPGVHMGSAGALSWSATTEGAAPDLILYRESAGALSLWTSTARTGYARLWVGDIIYNGNCGLAGAGTSNTGMAWRAVVSGYGNNADQAFMGTAYLFTSNGTYPATTVLTTDAAGILAQRNGTNAQAFRVYQSFTDTGNYTRFNIGWDGTGVLMGLTAAGTGNPNQAVRINANGAMLNIGASGGFVFGSDAANWWSINNSGHLLSQSDGTYNIGAPGANRPGAMYIMGNFYNGGNYVGLGYVWATTGFYGPNGDKMLGAAGATVTASDPILYLRQTWNAGGVTFTGILADFTATASAGTSLVLDLRVDGSRVFSVDQYGSATVKAGQGWHTNTRGWILAASDGVLALYNDALTGFSRLCFGGTSASEPAWQRDGVYLEARLADNSGGANVRTNHLAILGTLDHGGAAVGFYGVTPIARAVLATGAGATVDNVITALQNLGLVKQS